MKKSLKEVGLASLIALIFTVQIVEAQSNDTISVTIDGKVQNFDQPPIIKDGRTLVPLRGIFESLGATVDWDQKEKRITARKDGDVITLAIGDNQAFVNNKSIDLEVTAQLFNERTLVPIRFVAESLNKYVEWISINRKVSIYEKLESIKEPPKKDEFNLKSKELEGIFNNRISLGFPNTIPLKGVINIENLTTVGSGGDNIVRLSENGILYIDRDHSNNPGYHDGFDYYLGRLEVISELKENDIPISVTIFNNEITKTGGTPFAPKTKGVIWIGLIPRGETEVLAKTTLEVNIP